MNENGKGQGQFELLAQDIESTIENAEGNWWIRDNWLIVHTTISRDPRRRYNGGEYDYYREYEAHGLGVSARDDWSCDFAEFSDHGGDNAVEYDCIMSAETLARLAQFASIKIAARAVVAGEPGYMAKMRRAMEAL